MKLSTLHHSKTHRVCVFGGPKSGKTQLVGALSSHYNLLWFDLENGIETLMKLPLSQQEKVEVIKIPDTKVFPIAIETMLKVISGNKVSICDAHGKVSCPLCKKDNLQTTDVELNSLDDSWIVVVDSGTQLSQSAMNHITKAQPELYKPEWSDYRSQGALLEKFLSQVQQAKYNIVFITHEAEVEMEDGKKKLVPICGTTNFSRNTAKYFDHVVYADLKNKSHRFASATTYAANILTGSRTDVSLESQDVPSLLDIFVERGKVEETTASRALSNLSNLSAQLKKST